MRSTPPSVTGARTRFATVCLGLLGITLAGGPPALGAGKQQVDLRAEPPRPIVSIELFEEDGARPAFSAQGDRLAFDRAGSDGLYDIYLRELDGPGVRCLTCEARELRNRNNLRADWDPSGEHVIFLGQAKPERFDIEADDLLTAQRGLRADLFLFRTDGENFVQLTRVIEMRTAILDARFSFEAERIAWSQRVSSRGGPSGRWQVMVGELRLARGNARLDDVEAHEPPERPSLVLVQEFLPDERGVLISANLEPDQPESGRDLYELTLDGGALTRLTHSRNQLDEFAHISPTGTHIVWTSDTGLRPKQDGRLPRERLRELWIMERDGSAKQRLTHFNGDEEGESLGEAYVGDFDWHPDGDRLLVHVIHEKGGKLVDTLWQVTLDPSFRRQ